jgi:hypothetical protein
MDFGLIPEIALPCNAPNDKTARLMYVHTRPPPYIGHVLDMARV